VYSSDRVKIETPEQIALEFSLAGIGSRFLALAMDTLLQGVLYTIVFLLIFLIPGVGRLSYVPQKWVPAIAVLFVFCIYWGYFAAFEIFWHGQTPGKRVAGIRVIRDSGRPISVIEGIGRNLMRAIDGQFFYGVGLITMMISRQNRRLGDFVAGTIVVHERKSVEVKPDWSTPEQTQPVETTTEYNLLSEEDLVVIETYLHRRWDLDPLVRIKTAISIVERIRAKSGLFPDSEQNDDDFLEMVARRIRDQARFRPSSRANPK
jgi:uncharacterized RDD family membrane protein YckC